jgi:ubiquinone/menaquinone biosynthesis C-methylase UbiE
MNAFDQLASTYDSTLNPLLALEQRFLEPILPEMQGLVVADIGAGTGRWLHRIQARKSVAIDSSAVMLAQAPETRIVADAHRIPLRDNFADIVFCTFTLGYAPSCFPELIRITRRTLVVTDVHPERGWARMAPHQDYAIANLIHPSLTRTHLIEPHISEAERPFFSAKPHLYAPACEHPAIFIAVWNKQ